MSQYVYNKHNTTWKVLCTVFTHSLFLYQKSNEWAQRTSEISDFKNNSCVNTVRQHFPWSILYLCYHKLDLNIWLIIRNGRVDCKTVGFYFVKIGLASRVSHAQSARASHTPVGPVRQEKKTDRFAVYIYRQNLFIFLKHTFEFMINTARPASSCIYRPNFLGKRLKSLIILHIYVLNKWSFGVGVVGKGIRARCWPCEPVVRVSHSGLLLSFPCLCFFCFVSFRFFFHYIFSLLAKKDCFPLIYTTGPLQLHQVLR